MTAKQLDTRPLGRTGQHSTLAIMGAAALWRVTEAQVPGIMQPHVDHGVNHIDIAPSYGVAEKVIQPWLRTRHQDYFISTKTTKRAAPLAMAEIIRSRQRLGHIDLIQLHAVTRMDQLDKVTRWGGALGALQLARKRGWVRWIGITGHGHEMPAVLLEALNRFDFDTVIFPINFILWARPEYRETAEKLLALCQERNVGVMAIKAIAKEPWGEDQRAYSAWYRPFDDPAMLQQCVDFALSQPGVTGLPTSSAHELAARFLPAIANFKPMPVEQQEALIAQAGEYTSIF